MKVLQLAGKLECVCTKQCDVCNLFSRFLHDSNCKCCWARETLNQDQRGYSSMDDDSSVDWWYYREISGFKNLPTKMVNICKLTIPPYLDTMPWKINGLQVLLFRNMDSFQGPFGSFLTLIKIDLKFLKKKLILGNCVEASSKTCIKSTYTERNWSELLKLWTTRLNFLFQLVLSKFICFC